MSEILTWRGIPAVVKELQDKDPNIFGSGGTSRVYCILDIAYGVGMMLGPLICGGLAEAVGYLWMNLILGKFASLLFALTPSKDLNLFYHSTALFGQWYLGLHVLPKQIAKQKRKR